MKVFNIISVFIRKHWPIGLLTFFSLFIFTYQLKEVALIGDEAIYGQVARESIYRNSFLDFYWNRGLWFEKSPLLIWLTMLSFKILGVTESAARIFPVMFGVAGVIVTYFLSTKLFNDKLSGLLSGLTLVFLYPYIWFSRKGMMDIPLTFFISFSLYAFWRGYQGEKKWMPIAGALVGMGVLTKSVIGFFPLLIFIIFIVINREWKILKSKYFILSCLVTLAVILPWHLIMSVRHGIDFWNSYLGFHVWYRFIGGLHTSVGDKIDILFYIKKFSLKLSVLEVIFFLALIWVNKRGLKKCKKQLLFLSIWFCSVILLFSFSKTKLQHYIIPAMVPFACFIGWVLADLYYKRSEFLIFPSSMSLFNLLERYSVKLSESGANKVVVSYLTDSIQNKINSFFMLIIVGWCAIFYLLYKRDKKISAVLSLVVIILFNIIIPENPNRNSWIRATGESISQLSKGKPVVFNVEYDFKYPSYSVKFYLPEDSKFWYINKGEKMVYNQCNAGCTNFCFVENPKFDNDIRLGNFTTSAGQFFPCEIR